MSNASNKRVNQINDNRRILYKNDGLHKFSNYYTYRHPSEYKTLGQSEALTLESAPEWKKSSRHLTSQVSIHECPRVPYTYIDWGSALESTLAPLHKLLAPPASCCVACGKVISDSVKGYPEICSACYAAIPWIRHVKCLDCGRAIGCPDCTRQMLEPRYFMFNRSVVSYTPRMREWLARFKFRGDEALGGILARMVGDGLKRLEVELRVKTRRKGPSFFDIVTYVPISSQRMLDRGFNQARILANEAARVGRIPLLELLQRSRHTDKQSSKSRRQRIQDLDGIFIPSEDAIERVRSLKEEVLHNKEIKILLIDDVYTTGSTVDACAGALRELFMSDGVQAEIYSLTWARS